MTMTTTTDTIDRRAVATAFRKVERDLAAAGIPSSCAGRDDQDDLEAPFVAYRRNWRTDDSRDPEWTAAHAYFGWDRGDMDEAAFLVTVVRAFRRHGFAVEVPMSDAETVTTNGWAEDRATGAARAVRQAEDRATYQARLAAAA